MEISEGIVKKHGEFLRAVSLQVFSKKGECNIKEKLVSTSSESRCCRTTNKTSIELVRTQKLYVTKTH